LADPFAHRLDDTAEFVPHRARRRDPRIAVQIRLHVRPADGAGLDPNEHFAGCRNRGLQRGLDPEILRRVKNHFRASGHQ
jgi:hypothetical protein